MRPTSECIGASFAAILIDKRAAAPNHKSQTTYDYAIDVGAGIIIVTINVSAAVWRPRFEHPDRSPRLAAIILRLAGSQRYGTEKWGVYAPIGARVKQGATLLD
jgi:hypothetical protein